MSEVLTGNMFAALLGNDPEVKEEPFVEPKAPALGRSGKREEKGDSAPKYAQRGPAAAGSTRGGKKTGPTGNDAAFQSDYRRQNLDNPVNNEQRDRAARGSDNRGRGGFRNGSRGGRAPRDDRHSHTGIGEHDKQAAQGWGSSTAEGELADENGGLTDARKEETEGIVIDDTPVDENGVPVTEASAAPEDKTQSYEQYLAAEAEKKLALNEKPFELRKANEGNDKNFPEGKPFKRDDESVFIALKPNTTNQTQTGKTGRADKLVKVGLIDEWQESSSPTGRGAGRGDFRGGDRRTSTGRGRGGFRGGRGGRGGSNVTSPTYGGSGTNNVSSGFAATGATDFPALSGETK